MEGGNRRARREYGWSDSWKAIVITTDGGSGVGHGETFTGCCVADVDTKDPSIEWEFEKVLVNDGLVFAPLIRRKVTVDRSLGVLRKDIPLKVGELHPDSITRVGRLKSAPIEDDLDS